MGARSLPILKEVRACKACAPELPLGPKPLIAGRSSARILVIGQAPGRIAHETGIPWNDSSGERLRAWMGISSEAFYDDSITAIMPMGFCFPGAGRSGDMPPRPECAPLWHDRVVGALKNVELTVCAGMYAMKRYAPKPYASMTEASADFREQLPSLILLPHPSGRNNIWLRKNPWFEKKAIPALRQRVREVLGSDARNAS